MCYKVNHQFWGTLVAIIDKSVIHVNTKRIAYCTDCFKIFQHIFIGIDLSDIYNRPLKQAGHILFYTLPLFNKELRMREWLRDLLKVIDHQGVDQNKTICLLSVILPEEKWLDYLLYLILLCVIVHLNRKVSST